VHVKGVVPRLKSEPDGGEHPDVTGAVPPLMVGANVTTTGVPVDDTARGAGQTIESAPGGVTVTTDEQDAF
jgi:hypothetical protein